MKIVVLIPVFNDWDSVKLLLPEIDEALLSVNVSVDVFAVDDASTNYNETYISSVALKKIQRVSHIRLKRNLGHQKAIAIGLSYLQAQENYDAVIVMDADGEDNPKDIPKLLEKSLASGGEKIIFAHRSKRSESAFFKWFYKVYKSMYGLLVGHEITFGNFSIIPKGALNRIVVVSEIWNHYPAAVIKSRIPFDQVPTERAKRLNGESKMNFTSLVLHGLSAISVHGDVIGARSLIATMYLMIFFSLMIATVLIVRLAIPDWLPYVAGLSFIILLQAVTILLSFVFLVLSSKSNIDFIPSRDSPIFIYEVKTILINEHAGV